MPCLDKYPFLTDYFEKGIHSSYRNIAHCILFWGHDIDAQYELALEIARLLNCKNDGEKDCDCLNCNWIRENSHPAVLTYSKVDNKPSDDDSKTMFSINQARMIKNDLAVTSDYHRVLIFCDKDSDGNLAGLNQTNFSMDAANALLKTFEEPPENTTFFFLTNDITDMLSTVVSRSQCFFVPSREDDKRDFDLVQDLMKNYPNIPRNEVLNFYDDIVTLAKDNDCDEILNQIQNYLCEVLKSNSKNTLLRLKLIKDINATEKAKQELRLDMDTQTVVENLAYAIVLNN